MFSGKKILLVLSITGIIFTQPLGADTADAVRKAEGFMQTGEYRKALDVLNREAVPKERQPYAQWLKALSLLKLNDFNAALAVCDAVRKQGEENPWRHKMEFLAADIYTKQKNFARAEEIYEAEAKRLLSEDRKREIAAVYVDFAKALSYQPKPDEPDKPEPNYKQAYLFNKKALELEISLALREEIRFRMAGMKERDKQFRDAASEYRLYLDEFDPAWRKAAGDAEKDLPLVGLHCAEARYRLAESLLSVHDGRGARTVLEDLLALVSGKGSYSPDGDLGGPEKMKQWKAMAMRRMPAACGFPAPVNDADLEAGLARTDAFLKEFPDDSLSVLLAWQAVQALTHRGRAEEALARANRFVAKANFSVREKETAAMAAFREELGYKEPPLEMFDRLQKEALYLTGRLEFARGNYAQAGGIFGEYAKRFPNGPDWTNAQQGIIDAEYQIGLRHIAKKEYEKAGASWEGFLSKHPLDPRSRQILFTLAQISYQLGKEGKKAGRGAEAKAQFENALSGFKRLVSKYPSTEESSLAQFRIGEILEQELGDLALAVDAYKKVTWGGSRAAARARIERLVNKELLVKTERVYRTNEKALVSLQARNIKKVQLKLYKLNLDDYFHKFHTISGVENLDLALIAPDKTWDAELKGYKDYLPLAESLEIPMSGPGVYAVNIADEDYEATTIVIRSDIDIIVRSSRTEALVFAQNMVTNRPAENVGVILTNGSAVIGEGRTGKDGVLHKKLDELKSAESLQVFVNAAGHVASNGLSLSGLGFSRGLAPKAYLYTDRPVYRPGQNAALRGIVREIRDGSYFAPKDKVYRCSVTDPRGIVMFDREAALGEFGTFATEVALSAAAAQGRYSIRLYRDKESYAGSFLVEQYKLEKIKLSLDFDREVYFRGEAVEAVFTAAYYYGQAAAGKELRYTLPDGRSFQAKTDASGKVKIKFDTTPYAAGASLAFSGTLAGENVGVQARAFLAVRGFSASVSLPRSVSLAGEPVEVTVVTVDAAGKPAAHDLELSVLKRELEKRDPLMDDIPWLRAGAADTWAETLVETRKIATDAKGTARAAVTPKTGGQYIYRVKGADRFGNIVTAESSALVSGDDDAVALRLFAERQHYRVGEKAVITVHSRAPRSGLALVTYEGEGVIRYRVIEIKKGPNPVTAEIGHEHYPNFAFSVAMMHDNKLSSASLPVTVERELLVSLKPGKEVYSPGETAAMEIEIKDHLGRPAAGEFSLSLVNEAVFAKYSDPAGSIVAFFLQDAKREAEMRLAASCTFAYSPATRQVSREIAMEDKRVAEEEASGAGYADANGMRSSPEPVTVPQTERQEKPKKSMMTKSADKDGDAVSGKEDEALKRLETGLEGYWTVVTVTDKTGRGTVSLPLPEAAGAFRVTAKGCTADTLVGEKEAVLVIRSDFFADLKTPAWFQEGDEVRFTAAVHNPGDFSGKVKAALTVTADGKPVTLEQSLSINRGETAAVVFPPYTVPRSRALGLSLEVTTDGSARDGLALSVPVKPWGLPFADRTSGTAQSDTAVSLELPDNLEDARMSVSVDRSVSRALVDYVLGAGGPFDYEYDLSRISFPASDQSGLLAYASLLGYLKNREGARADFTAARRFAENLAAALAAVQRNDGSFRYGNGSSEIEITALAYWALASAGERGIAVDPQVLEKSRTFLKNVFTQVSQDDYELRALILHALAQTKDADYAFVNRLYRNRNVLSRAALAYTALSLHALDHDDMGRELLDLLDAACRKDAAAGTAHWSGEGNLPWQQTDAETTALAALAFVEMKPEAKLLAPAVAYLLAAKDDPGSCPAKAKGIVAAALAGYYAGVKEGGSDYTLAISVNGRPLGAVNAKKTAARTIFDVPPELIVKGKNRVAFALEGRGEYLYTVRLAGFSRDLKAVPAWKEPLIVSKEYIHEDLTFNGRPIGESTMRIKELESGAAATVALRLRGRTGKRYFVLSDPVPAGATVLEESLTGGYSRAAVEDGRVVFFFEPDRNLDVILTYKIAGYLPGRYRVLPPVLSDAFHFKQKTLGEASALTLLAPSEKSGEEYVMNKAELFGLGKANFDAGGKKEALALLERLYARDKKYRQAETAQMLLWLRSEPENYDAKKLVEYFEILKENHPDLSIPFAKILEIGRAYRDIGEHERAYLVYRATVEASFLKDALTGGVLEQAKEVVGSIDFMTRLWREYPDSAPVIETYLALAQEVYDKAVKAGREPEASAKSAPTRQELYGKAEGMFRQFLSVYAAHPLADDAAFSMINLKLDLKAYPEVVALCRQFRSSYPSSDFFNSFQYMEALGWFSMGKFDEAIGAAKVVADKESEDRDLAVYILSQIYHARMQPAKAIEYYRRVSDKFPDAREAAEYFLKKDISLEEVSSFKPGEKVTLKLKYRNIKTAHVQAYKVDLMKLYLKEKNLSRITRINLSGISPQVEAEIKLGNGEDYLEKEKPIALALSGEGAYLVICRGDDLFASCLVLVTPLAIEIQEEAASGRLRVNVKNTVKDAFANNVHVKVIGSENSAFVSGETDMRGILVADGIAGIPTVIARDSQNRYAFYRGKNWMGVEEAEKAPARNQDADDETNYRGNLELQQRRLNESNRGSLDKLYENKQEGVQVDQVF